MEHNNNGKGGLLTNFLVRLILLFVVIVLIQFSYIATLRRGSCDFGDFCFFSMPENFNIVTHRKIIVSTGKLAPENPQNPLKKYRQHDEKSSVESRNKCSVEEYKLELIRKAEPLIDEEPKKPWITLKKNMQAIKYLSSVLDLSFKQRYVYVDVGARSYGSSIVSWFKKQYPKQNKTFEIYAIEADRIFHKAYEYKKGVTLLPYAAWVRNETLFFEINGGMGRIRPVNSSTSDVSVGDMDEIRGFDFAEWLKSTVSDRDNVVMKMDVEGTEFDLIPRLFETGAICLIDEIFLECHYNRWQKCCPGERSRKYEKTYEECLDLFTSLRKNGVLVHQWW